MLMKNPNSEHETLSMASSTAAGEKTAKKKTLITDNGGLVWGNNNKGIVVVKDSVIWFNFNCRCPWQRHWVVLSLIVAVMDNGI